MASIHKALKEVLEEVPKYKSKALFKTVKEGATKLDDLAEEEVELLSKRFSDYLRKAGNGKADDVARKYIDDIYTTDLRVRKRINDIEAAIDLDEKAAEISKITGKDDLRRKLEAQRRFSTPEYQARLKDYQNMNWDRSLFSVDEQVENLKKFTPDFANRYTDDELAGAIRELRSQGSLSAESLNIYSAQKNEIRNIIDNSYSYQQRINNRAAATAEAVTDSVSTGNDVTSASIRKAAKNQSVYDYIMKREASKYDYDTIRKGYSDMDEFRNYVSQLTNTPADRLQSEADIRSALSAGLHNRASNANAFDYINYYKIPQTAAGVGMTAWLVNKLSESKGQMSNSQLYGQQPF